MKDPFEKYMDIANAKIEELTKENEFATENLQRAKEENQRERNRFSSLQDDYIKQTKENKALQDEIKESSFRLQTSDDLYKKLALINTGRYEENNDLKDKLRKAERTCLEFQARDKREEKKLDIMLKKVKDGLQQGDSKC